MNEVIAVPKIVQTHQYPLDRDEGITLKDSDSVMLSKCELAGCRSDCSRITVNFGDRLQKRALPPDIDVNIAARCRAWSGFQHSGLPMIVLIGGCTGTGKSTVAAELAQRLDIGRIQSTDILRDVVRLFVSEQLAPELHVSSYNAWRVSPYRNMSDHNQDSHLIAGFRAQSDKLATTIDAVIARSIKERVSIIIEGVHINPDYYRRVVQDEAVVIPLLLTNPSTKKLKRHFLRRGEVAPSRGATGYLENFSEIWQVQNFLVGEAKRYEVPIIVNTDLDDTLRRVIGSIMEHLQERFL